MIEDDRSSLLLVDDDDTFREVLGRALERRGYAVTSAGSVEAALIKAQEQPPEYAVVDLKMPGDSGLVLIEKLIELDPSILSSSNPSVYPFSKAQLIKLFASNHDWSTVIPLPPYLFQLLCFGFVHR